MFTVNKAPKYSFLRKGMGIGLPIYGCIGGMGIKAHIPSYLMLYMRNGD